MSDALRARMVELGRRFAAQAPEECAGFRNELAGDDRIAVQSRAHRLAGIAGMFGQPAISEAAFALEEVAETGGDMHPPAERLLALLAAL